ncbi:MAG: hypothetical protein Q8P40_11525 [Nitrospirota bacterium]|nr:hypothetical protein [Nitrospirota bacterium]
MANPTIEISKQQVINALLQLTPKELKNTLNALFKQKLFIPPTLREITKEASSIVKREGIGPDVVEEAIKWARVQK